MLVGLLVTLTIVALLIGGIPTPAEALMVLVIGVPMYLMLVFVRNRFADGISSLFLGGGAPPVSTAELRLDTADGYAHQQEYDAALYAYEQALADAPRAQRATVMLRLAETAVLAGRPDEALRWWTAALKQKKGMSPEQRAGALFRMAEVLTTTSNDVPGAARLLKQVRDDYPGTKYATFAADRLRELVRQG